jgi:hypothetical protein
MPDITAQIKTAIGEEPPLGFEPADVIAAARRVRRRRGVYAAASAGVAAAVAAGTVLALPGAGTGGQVAGRATELSLTSLSHIASKRPSTVPGVSSGVRVDGVTAGEVFTLFIKDTGAKLAFAKASLLRPPGELDLVGGLAAAGYPYLNVQVAPPGTMSTTTPTCAELSDAASGDGDGYYGPCTIRRLADGSILVVRSGETKQGHFAMAQASLIRPDGSGVFAEDTNQAFEAAEQGQVAKDKSEPGGKPALPPVVAEKPPVSASTLAAFVRDVAGRS